jgi:hypothetical protein
LCLLKHLNTALECILLLLICIILGVGRVFTCISDMAFYLPWLILHRLYVSSFINIMYVKKSKYYTTALFLGDFQTRCPLFRVLYNFDFICFIFIFYFLSTLYFRDTQNTLVLFLRRPAFSNKHKKLNYTTQTHGIIWYRYLQYLEQLYSGVSCIL